MSDLLRLLRSVFCVHACACRLVAQMMERQLIMKDIMMMRQSMQEQKKISNKKLIRKWRFWIMEEKTALKTRMKK